jgi:hypothetical protein
MNSHRFTDDAAGDAGDAFGAEQIEEALLRLPPIDVPAELESTLIAAIPRGVVEPTVPKEWPARPGYRRWIAFSAAAVVVLIVLGTMQLFLNEERTKVPGELAKNDNRTGSVVAIKLAISKETDPCNILPPLGDWR